MVENRIKQTIEEHHLIHAGDHIVIGLSGGPDSVCLFHVLRNLREEIGFALYAVHINHRLRPGDAEEDQKYVEYLCERANIVCVSMSYDCKEIARIEKITDEEAGRRVRYDSFTRVAKSLIVNGVLADKVKIAVAQNANDQAETLLQRILRGTGPDGLAGIAYRRQEKDIAVIRPLLDAWRAEIEQYCEEHRLRPRTDQTNLQPLYTRNKIRLELIPYLEKNFNETVTEALIRLSKAAAMDKEYLGRLTGEAYRWAEVSDHVLQTEKLAGLYPAIRRRVIMKAFEAIGLSQDITAAHLEAADRLLRDKGLSKTIDFPHQYAMTVTYEGVCFHKRGQQAEPTGPSRTIELAARLLEPGEPVPEGCAVFDWGKIKAGCQNPKMDLRTRQPGDYIQLKVGRKKLQDFMVDQKIPQEIRDRIPLVTVGQEVLWMVGQERGPFRTHRYSQGYQAGAGTKEALLLEIICEM